jgi:hypothetical protein
LEPKLALAYAAQSGNVEVMSWLMQLPGMHFSEHVMSATASWGHAAMCRYLHTQQCPWDTSCTNAAVRRGSVDLLRWLMDSGCPWDAHEMCMTAAQGTKKALLEYLQQLGLLSSAAVLTEMLYRTAWYHNLAAAKWLRQQGAEWPAVYTGIPWEGRFLEWAISEGFTPPTD